MAREVTLAKPGEASRIAIKHRNLEAVDLTVYKVDLMRLYLMRKSLADMGAVQLFGIAGVAPRTLTPLGDESLHIVAVQQFAAFLLKPQLLPLSLRGLEPGVRAAQ